MEAKFSAQAQKKAISFYYLLAYCPSDKLKEFLAETKALASGLPKGIEKDVAARIVAFHSGLREPEEKLVKQLAGSIKKAAKSQKGLMAYKVLMEKIFAMPGRAKAENRLHRKKGCRFCASPCAYGYFSLVSEPRFELLQQLLDAEKEKAPEEKSAVRAAWLYAFTHLSRTAGSDKGFISSEHLGNLAYCLLMLSMAKSRYPLPEEQIKTFQARNQELIANWGPGE
ncbi:MAG: hypothetical protein ABFS17_07805 [Chloroflexota bacterium]